MSKGTEPRQLVVFKLAGQPYALPIKHVQEIIRYTRPREVASVDVWVRGVLSLRGRILPVYDLAARLGLSAEIDEQAKIVIIESGSESAGVIVDEVDEVLTVGADRFEGVPGADEALIDSIAKIDDRLIVLLAPTAIFSAADLAAA
ncbi:MAG: chemotaxis protein CheW [Solirubrobacteraceae bacterium]